MNKWFLIVCLFIPAAAFADILSWADVESRVLNSSLEIQVQTHEATAAKIESNGSISAFLPEVSLNAGLGHDTTVRDDDRGTQEFVEANWNLYRGGKDSAIKEKYKKLSEFEDVGLNLKKREILFKARQFFINLISIKKFLEVLDREAVLNHKQKEMAQKKVSAGLTSSVDKIEFDLRDDIIAAEQNSLRSKQEKMLAEFKSLLDLNEKTIDVKGELDVPTNKELSDVDLIQSPLNQRALLGVKISKADSHIARSEFFPEINLSTTYGRRTLQDTEPIKNNETTVLLSVTLPIFKGFETLNHSKAQAERVFAKEMELRQTRSNLQATEVSIRSGWRETWALYELSLKTRERVKKYYELTLAEYRRGVKNSPDLVSATERFFESEKNTINLSRDLILLKDEFNKTF